MCSLQMSEVLLLRRVHTDAISSSRDPKVIAQVVEVLERMLLRLWEEAPERTLDLILRMRKHQSLSWSERGAAKHDLIRLIDSLIAANWVDGEDRAELVHILNRRLEQASPRLWQQFCHWRRHRFPRFFPDALRELQ